MTLRKHSLRGLGGPASLVLLLAVVFRGTDWEALGLALRRARPAPLLGLSGRSISILTSFIPIIVLVVGVSDAIHLLTRYRHNRSELGDNEEAIARTFSELTVACFYTSATTAIGFLSLVGTRIGIIMEFGFFTAVAILLTYVFSMTLLPALLGFSARLKFNDRGLRPGWPITFGLETLSRSKKPPWVKAVKPVT